MNLKIGAHYCAMRPAGHWHKHPPFVFWNTLPAIHSASVPRLLRSRCMPSNCNSQPHKAQWKGTCKSVLFFTDILCSLYGSLVQRAVWPTYLSHLILSLGVWRILERAHRAADYSSNTQAQDNVGQTASASSRASFCLKKGFVPHEVLMLFRSVQPSLVGHVKHIVNILKSELWRLVRLFHDLLCVWCFSWFPEWAAEAQLRSLRAKLLTRPSIGGNAS